EQGCRDRGKAASERRGGTGCPQLREPTVQPRCGLMSHSNRKYQPFPAARSIRWLGPASRVWRVVRVALCTMVGVTDDNAVARLFYEVGQLKRTPRTGWFYAGVAKSEVESVAEHSFRTAIVAYVLAALDGANPERAAILALFHDTQESRTSDIAYIGKQYLGRPDHELVTADQTARLPESAREPIRGLVNEYEGQNSREAVLARDADKLECLLQAREYQL